MVEVDIYKRWLAPILDLFNIGQMLFQVSASSIAGGIGIPLCSLAA